MASIHIARGQQQLGTFEEEQVLASLRAGAFLPGDLAWREGMNSWKTLRELFPGAPMPPPMPAAVYAAPPLGDDRTMRMLLPVGRSGWAIAAGYLGLFALIIFPAPLALIVSLIAIWDIRRTRGSAHPKRGLGRAIFGLVVGIIGSAALAFILLSRR